MDDLRRIEHHLVEAIRTFLADRSAYERGELEAGDARVAVASLLDTIAWAIGPAMAKDIWGDLPPDAPRSSVLAAISQRLGLISPLTKHVGDQGSFQRTAEEVVAISEGDTPALFARLQNGRKRKFREMKEKLEALSWDRFLEAQGVQGAERHAAISQAYKHEWDTISRWEKDVRASLGDSLVDKKLARAHRDGSRHDDERAQELGLGWRVQLAADGPKLGKAMRQSRGTT